jgi:hypothetical protein
MIYSYLHSLYYRIVIKLRKLRKKRNWSEIPNQIDTTYFSKEFMLYEPHLAGASTFKNLITDSKTAVQVLQVLEELTPGEMSLEFVKNFYRKGLEKFGDHWKYADINTAIFIFSKFLTVENYLEIGVRRGRSMSIFASQSKTANIYGFDMWIPGYAGSENPGETLVREELAKFDFDGKLTLIDGDSKKTIPNFFKENNDLYFDLITVDGDHSIGGAKKDLKNVVERLKIGGVLVFDDISSQEHPYLNRLWKKVIKDDDRFYTYEYGDLGLGVAFAIRKY